MTNDHVTDELGNYDYLMGSDVHVGDPAVSAEMDRWAARSQHAWAAAQAAGAERSARAAARTSN